MRGEGRDFGENGLIKFECGCLSRELFEDGGVSFRCKKLKIASSLLVYMTNVKNVMY